PPTPAPGYDPASRPLPAMPAPAPGHEPFPGPPPASPPGAAPAQDPYPYPAYPYPQTGQPVQPAAPRRWLTPTTAAVAVAALAIGAASVWFVARDTGEEPAHAGPTASVAPPSGEVSPTPSDPATRSASPTASASPTPSPSGSDPAHETVRDAKGFTIAVPAGWAREDGATGVFYRSPDRAALLQIFQVSEPELTPLAAVQGASTYLRAQTTGYQEIRVGPATDAPEGGELVYEYDSAESHGRRRGVERVFVAEDGKKWAVLTAGPAGEWTLTQAHHAAALSAFRPTGG
ncbi:serine/arginine repetitive matrix protein 2, partial [Streptomyces sp. NPDC006450]|uniref:serine/arginine repetitive matrix protein 2 n=1 Tax=Streptomyces sp. NPDC006450 TaxID=3155458 RepID=UPI0033B9D5EE